MTDMQRTEAELRTELADFYNLVDYFGWSENIFSHISLRVDGPGHCYLVNAFGYTYDEITPERLVKVNAAGEIVEKTNQPVNPASSALHGAIHANRADLHCVAHVHTAAASAIAGKREGFRHDNFPGAQLAGMVAYHDFEGITLYDGERERILASLGDRSILVLRNHGLVVCGHDVPSTFSLLFLAQRSAEIQMLQDSMRGEDIPIPDDIKQRCVRDGRHVMEDAGATRMLFSAAVRKMRRDQAGAGYAVMRSVRP